MQYRVILTSILLVFSLCLFSTYAFAEGANEGGLDLRFGLAGDVLRLKYDVSLSGGGFSASESSDYTHLNGVMGKIAIGYRWNMGGIYLEQDMGGLWYGEDSESAAADFLGGTFLVGRFILPATDSLQFELGAGVGMMYGAEDRANGRMSLIVDENGNPAVAFAVKATLGMNFYITRNFGMGVFCDYNYAFKQYSATQTVSGIRVTGEITAHYHNVTPGVQFMLKF